MADPSPHDLERELARFRPAPLPDSLRQRLQQEPVFEADNLTFADRILVTFSSLGAVAAAIIVLVGVMQMSAPRQPQPSPAEIVDHQRMALEYQRLLASR